MEKKHTTVSDKTKARWKRRLEMIQMVDQLAQSSGASAVE